MKTKKSVSVHIICLLLLILCLNNGYAQSWGVVIPAWHNPQDVITMTGNSSTGVTYNFSPYNNWTPLSYSTSVTLGSNKTLTISLASTSTTMYGKYLSLQLTNAAGQITPLNPSALLSIAAPNPATPTVQPAAAQYSVDFALIAQSNFDFSSAITGITCYLYNDIMMSTSPNNLTGNLTISAFAFSNGTPGNSYQVNGQAASEWELQTNGFISPINTSHGLAIGNPETGGMSALLSSPYYSFVVNGRTNFIGNDNAIGIWSANLPSTGYRHYLGMSNATFTGTTTEYSLINAYEYNSNTGRGNPKHLTLQNFSTTDGNLGIGQFTTSAPLAKLHVNGNVLIGTTQPGSAFAGYALAVAGQIVSQSIAVTAPSTWADFVFQKSYALPDLKAQAKYIQEHGHLQGVPSEKEVIENGYDVSKMDANLLRKIEELYLYTIELQKTVESLKQQVNAK